MAFGLIFYMVIILSPAVSAGAERVEVLIEGIKGDILKNVQAALDLPPGLEREGRVDRSWLELFEKQVPERARHALEPFGYFQPQIETTLLNPEKGLFLLRVNVRPGNPVTVTSLKLEVHGEGEKEAKLRELIPRFPLKLGDTLRQDRYEEGKAALKARALNLGYLDADFSAHLIRLFLSENRAEIDLVLETGPQYRFGHVAFTGAPAYPDSFLRRYLDFQAGEIFMETKVAQTQLNFINSDRFREVAIDVLRDQTQDHGVPILVNLSPSEPKRLRLGVGYETDLGARVSARYQDLNFNRRGHELDAELNISQRLQGLVTSYTLPGLRNLDTKLSFKLGLQKEDTDTYDSRSIFFRPEYTHGLGRGRLGSIYLETRLEDFTVGAEDGRSRLVMPGLRFTQRQYDDLIRPKRGYHYGLELRGTNPVLGSDVTFLQFLAGANFLVPLPHRFSIILRGETGTTWRGPVEEMPPSVRFFAGGDRSVRGYAYRSLGPENAAGDVEGGKHLLVASAEIEKALGKIFAIAAFYDVGNAFNSLVNMDLQQGAGLGIRFYTPVGPIRLDVARQVGVKDPKFRIHFSAGFAL